MDSKVDKLQQFLETMLDESELKQLAMLAVWHGFTGDMVGDEQRRLLGLFLQLGLLRCQRERYSMHALVRAAAERRLEGDDELRRSAERGLVQGMARLGDSMEHLAQGSPAAARELLQEEGPNIQRLQRALQKAGQPAALAHGALGSDTLDGLASLSRALFHCGMHTETLMVRRLPTARHMHTLSHVHTLSHEGLFSAGAGVTAICAGR